MPSLPLPTSGADLSGGDLPVSSVDDVLGIWPSSLKTPDPAPIRDAVLAAIAAMFAGQGYALGYQDLAAYCAAQSDVLRATGIYLDGLFEDRDIRRQVGETDADYRTRGLAFQVVVTTDAIVAAVNSILAPASDKECQVFDATLDRAFLFSTDMPRPFSAPGVQPQYLDRLYHEDLAVNGVARDNAEPGGMWVFSDAIGRYFVVRIPDLAPIDALLQLCYSGTKLDPGDKTVPELGGATPSSSPQPPPGYLSAAIGGTGLYTGDGTNAAGSEADGSVATFLYSNTTDSSRVYETIVNTIERIKGHSIRWMLYVDPSL
jgi:hypothetical protein